MGKTTTNKLRALAATVVAIALAAACVPAFAALAANDSLPPSTGNLHIHKYVGADLDKAGAANDGTEVTNIDSSFTPLEGITFHIYKVAANASGDYPGKAPYRLSSTTLTDGDGNTFTVSAASTASVTTAADGSATASNLPQGVYLVTEDESESVSVPADPFVVAVPMTNADGDGWLSDVHVYPKNETMTDDKELKADTKDDAAAQTQSGTSVNVGDTVTWTITPSVPSEIVAYKKNDDGTPATPTSVTSEDANISYTVYDELDEALTYTDGSVKVYGIKSTDNEKTGGTLVSQSGNYTVTLDTATNKLSVSFTAAGRLALYNADYKKLRVEIDTVVNAKVLNKTVHKIGNDSSVEFVNKFDQTKTAESETVEIHTAAIDITKTDATNTSTKLAGAKFQIADSEANAKAGNYLKKTADGYIVDPSDSRYATASAWVETTDANGKATFSGLEDYTSVIAADGTETPTYCSYWLVETQAPEGYNLPASPFKVTFTEDGATETANWTLSTTITNTNEFTLPLTGGMGTMLLTLVGVMLVGGAGIALFSTRKKKGAQAK